MHHLDKSIAATGFHRAAAGRAISSPQFQFIGRAQALFIAGLFGLLAGCGKLAEVAPTEQAVVSGDTVRIAANSPMAQRLLVAPVVSAQESVLKLPARIVWDEDHTSRIMSPVAGRIDGLAVQAGASVKAEQALAYLSSPDLGTAQTEAARARADLAQAERNLARIKDLAEAGVVAGKDLEQARGDLARSSAEAARTGLRLKSLGAAGTVDQRFVLRSPIAGVVVERNANPGMEWRPDQPGSPLFVVSDPTYLWCWIDAPERVLGTLHPGMKLQLRANAFPQESFEAQIDHISDALDPASRSVKVRARLRNPERRLKGEMYVTAELTRPAQGVLDVPAKAVILSNGAQQVFVKSVDGQFVRKTIVPIAVSDQWVSIDRGLDKVDLVVVDGALYLQKLLDEAGPQPASATLSENAFAPRPVVRE